MIILIATVRRRGAVSFDGYTRRGGDNGNGEGGVVLALMATRGKVVTMALVTWER